MKALNKENINNPEHYNNNYKGRDIDKPTEVEGAKRLWMFDGIENGMKVVELGCGVSSLLKTIKSQYPDCEVHAMDFADGVIAKLKTTYPEIKYQVGDALNTPYENDYFDYVVAGELIEHIPNPDDLVKEMARICKKGGTISVSTPFMETVWRPNDVPTEHLWEYDRDDMLNIFSKYGETKVKFFVDKDNKVGGIHMVTNCKII